MSGGTNRVTHVVQAVEETDQVEQTVIAGRTCYVEPGSRGDSRLGRPQASHLDRRGVKVEPAKCRIWIGGSHRYDGRPVTASDVGHPSTRMELRLDPIKCRDPLGGEICPVACPEEPLG